jgi:DNA repair exonuclease SbcCD ATPase subunit
MAEQRLIEIKGDVAQAEASFKALTETIKEQKDQLQFLREEAQKVKEALEDTSPADLSRITALTKQQKHLTREIQNQRLALSALNLEKQKQKGDLSFAKRVGFLNKNLIQSQKYTRALNMVTMGYYGTLAKGIKLFTLVKGGFLAMAAGASFFTKTLIATGIGAIIVGVGLLIANFGKLKDLVNGVSGEQTKQLQRQQELVSAEEDKLKSISAQENILRQQGKSEKDILKLKIDQTKATITALEAQLLTQKEIRASQISAAKRNQKILAGFIAFLTAPISLILGMVDAITYAASFLPGIGIEATSLAADFTMGAASFFFDPAKVEEEGDKTIKETENQLNGLKNTLAGHEIAVENIEKKGSDNRKKNREKAYAEEKKALEDHLANLKSVRDFAAVDEEERHQLALTKLDEQAKELRKATVVNFDKQIKAAGDDAEKVKQLEKEKNDALFDIDFAFLERTQDLQDDFDDKQLEKKQNKRIEELQLETDFEKLSFDARRQRLQEQRDLILNDETLSEKQRKKMLEANSKASTEIDKLEFEEKQRALGAYANALSAFSSLLGKETAAGKATAVAASLINTYAAIAAQLKAFSGIPVPGYAIAQAVATGVQGFMAVKEILAVKVPGGGGGGGSAPKSMPTAPTFNVVGGSETTQLAAAIGEQEQQPVQAFVVSQDVTSAQSLENNIIEGATIGG